MTIPNLILTAWSGALLVPSLVFAIEVIVGCLKRNCSETVAARDGASIAVLIPAHNEGSGIKRTIEDVKQQLHAGDRLLVVADNCTDNTADVAAELGAEIVIRKDPSKVGKGYALDFGIQHLTLQPPDIVLVVDADCRLGPAAIDRLAGACSQSQRPVQALYLMKRSQGSSVNQQVAEFAWQVKNWVRPLGLQAMGLPCQLMGSGMAFPWRVIRAIAPASGSIVEDMELGLELAAAGYAPRFCPSAIVTSTFPTSVAGTATQRRRWEQGHIQTILSKAPSLFSVAIRKRNKDLWALTVELIVPPVTLLALLVGATVMLSALAWVAGVSHFPLAICLLSLSSILFSVGLAWFAYGRKILPGSAMPQLLLYALTKVKLYVGLLTGNKTSSWVRTDRS